MVNKCSWLFQISEYCWFFRRGKCSFNSIRDYCKVKRKKNKLLAIQSRKFNKNSSKGQDKDCKHQSYAFCKKLQFGNRNKTKKIGQFLDQNAEKTKTWPFPRQISASYIYWKLFFSQSQNCIIKIQNIPYALCPVLSL